MERWLMHMDASGIPINSPASGMPWHSLQVSPSARCCLWPTEPAAPAPQQQRAATHRAGRSRVFACAEVHSYSPDAHLFGQVFRSAHGQRQNRQRRILRATGSKGTAIHHKEISDVVALVEWIQH